MPDGNDKWLGLVNGPHSDFNKWGVRVGFREVVCCDLGDIGNFHADVVQAAAEEGL